MMISFRTTVIDAFDVKGVQTGKEVGWGRGLTIPTDRTFPFSTHPSPGKAELCLHRRNLHGKVQKVTQGDRLKG